MGAAELGRYLKNLRQHRKLTLRAVEKETEVSNSYLSQLESGKIRNPSPTVLHKLSKLYGSSYATLMKSAGYPVPGKEEGQEKELGFAARIGPVTSEEEDDLIDYLEFLRSRHRRDGK